MSASSGESLSVGPGPKPETGQELRSGAESVTEPGPKFPLGTIYFYLTEGCNLRCRHCWIAPKFQTQERTYPALDLGLFVEILEQAKPLGLGSVKLTGGEPLLHPQIREIIEQVKGADLGLTIETNGVLCTPELAQMIAASKAPFVSVSLDGAEAETHEWVRGVKGCFEAALVGARYLAEAGLRPQLIMTVMRRNRDQMKRLVELAESVGAGSVKFNLLQPTARGEAMHEVRENLPIGELIELGRWVESELRPSSKLAIYFDAPFAFRSLSRIFGEQGDGCSRCGILHILGVLWDGSYALCGIGATVPELIFGHAARDPLADVWNNNQVLIELRSGLPKRLEGICSECMMRGICLGSCLAQNYYLHHSLWAPYWFCAEAEQAGLFPSSRRRASHKTATQRAEVTN